MIGISRKNSTIFDEEIKRTVINLLKIRYNDASLTHSKQDLKKHHAIYFSCNTVASWLFEEDLILNKVPRKTRRSEH